MRTRTFEHRYTVQAPLSQVLSLFYTPAMLSRLTPPPLSVRFQALPTQLETGTTVTMQIGIGPVATTWVARFTDVSPTRFVDEQIQGPFPSWVHEHDFRQVTPDTTEIRDRITVALGKRDVLGWCMWLGLPGLFLFRRWRTPSLLAQHQAQTNREPRP